MTTLTQKQINKIPIAERILLAEKLWESIPENSDAIGISDDQKQELDNRLDMLEQGKVQTVSWLQIKAKLHERRT